MKNEFEWCVTQADVYNNDSMIASYYIQRSLVVLALAMPSLHSAFAEPSDSGTEGEPVPTATGEPTKSLPQKSSLSDITALRIAMHETAFETSPTDHARSDLASALEDAIHEICMPRLPRETTYIPPKQENECSGMIDRLLAIVPDHATALCARDGFGAKTCIDAFEEQELAPISTYSEPKRAGKDELEGKLTNSTVAAQVNEMASAYTEFKRAHKAPYDDATTKQVLSRIYSILQLACIQTIVRYQKPEEIKKSRSATKLSVLTREPFRTDASPTHGRRSQSDPAAFPSSDNPFKDFEKQLGIEEKVDKAPKELVRVRYLPDACVSYIGEAFKIRKGDATATCHREGFQTPRCLRAIERSRANQRVTTDPSRLQKRDGHGIGTF